MPTQIFPCTPKQYAAFRAAITAQGIALPAGDSGDINDTKHGILFGYNYDSVGNQLTVVIKKKPFYIPASTIFQAIQDELNSVAA